MKDVMKGLLVVLMIMFGYVVLVLVLNEIHRYKPSFEEKVLLTRGKLASYVFPSINDTFSVVSWNIGYGGLGRNNTFFYDGGKQVKPTREQYEKNFSGIVKTIQLLDSVPFILLQEVDFSAKRSFYVNQQRIIMDVLPSHWATQAVNYNAYFVPVPFLQPMGKVQGGLLTLFRYYPVENMRIAFHSLEKWPKSLFFLQRCFSYHRFYLSNGKYLYIVNLHLSAFDEGSEARWLELILLRSYLLNWYGQGHYVVVGGDWNTNPPAFRSRYLSKDVYKPVGEAVTKVFFPQGWQWVYDSTYPSNRFVATPYQKGVTPTTTIDYFLVSPNVNVLDVRTLYNEFEFSDHNPVYLKFCLKPYESTYSTSF